MNRKRMVRFITAMLTVFSVLSGISLQAAERKVETLEFRKVPGSRNSMATAREAPDVRSSGTIV